MNAPIPVDEFVDTNMTSKGQVLIPKSMRDKLGLLPNGPVRVAMNDRGEVTVKPLSKAETPDERRARIRAAIESVRGTVDIGFATTDEYMDFIRPHRRDPL